MKQLCPTEKKKVNLVLMWNKWKWRLKALIQTCNNKQNDATAASHGTMFQLFQEKEPPQLFSSQTNSREGGGGEVIAYGPKRAGT